MIEPKDKLPQIPQERIGKKHGKAESSPGAKKIVDKIRKWWSGNIHTHSEKSTRDEYFPFHLESEYYQEEIITYLMGLGLQFVVFTDHASNPASPCQLDKESSICQSLLEQKENIARLRKRKDFLILSGAEASVFLDNEGNPQIDIPDYILDRLDLVIVSRHAQSGRTDEEQKECLLEATRVADIIGHPDRHCNWKRVLPEVLTAMKVKNIAYEINISSLPNDSEERRAILKMIADSQVMIAINYDIHSFDQFADWGLTEEEIKLVEKGVMVKEKWGRGERLSAKELEILKAYKQMRLSSGPGVLPGLKLLRVIKDLEGFGVEPERIINSSRESLLNFLIKRGKNLD